MAYYFGVDGGVNNSPGSQSYDETPSVLTDERAMELSANAIIRRESNLSGSNPYRSPLPRSLFYDAGFRSPGKYGQYLFYSFGNNANDFMEQYYKSESGKYNLDISSLASKNPSAAALVKATAAINTALNGKTPDPGKGSNIIGGISAPYNWKDFLYCKYYGTIPNNYMITLRRFPTPMRDNLSLPEGIKGSVDVLKEGAGRPVAQAVTWWGGDTGNNLSDFISFTTGLNWEDANQDEMISQEAFEKGIISATTLSVTDLSNSLSGSGVTENADKKDVLSLTAMLSDPESLVQRQRGTSTLRDIATEEGGPLSDYLWTSVDTVKSMQIRGSGLNFIASEMTLKFTYDLTSVGQVNTKAAILDLMGSLLALGTNYGNFLTPDFRYNSEFPAIGFPGGAAGYEQFLANPVGFVKSYSESIKDTLKDLETSGQSITDQARQANQSSILNTTNTANQDPSIEKTFRNAAGIISQNDWEKNLKMPMGFYTGAPTGEWHLVIGNPMNPIAMIGNLICTGVTIDFNDKLGPDDFPTELYATFSVKHARDRERGEIESMFNRGEGKLYQSVLPVSSNQQTQNVRATPNGTLINEDTAQLITQQPILATQSAINGYSPQ
jgi:hypothetical protein